MTKWGAAPMADLPILFSAPMVRALIDGRKTQTRRKLKHQPTMGQAPIRQLIRPFDAAPHYEWQWRSKFGANLGPVDLRIKPGDRLYVREHWRVSQRWDETPPRDLPARTMTIFCEAGGSIANQASGRWEPDNDYPPSRPEWVGKHRQAMHMPKWASRITLIVEAVKVERLQDISREDAVAEGLIKTQFAPALAVEMGCDYGFDGDSRHGSPVSAYAALWNSINGPGAWDANPWVVAYTFRRIMGNIDSLPVAA